MADENSMEHPKKPVLLSYKDNNRFAPLRDSSVGALYGITLENALLLWSREGPCGDVGVLVWPEVVGGWWMYDKGFCLFANG